MPPSLSELLGPAITEVEASFVPGLTFLTWSSINIDNFIHQIHKVVVIYRWLSLPGYTRLHAPQMTARNVFMEEKSSLQALGRLEYLASRTFDILINRIEKVYTEVSNMMLVDLPFARLFELSEFVEWQRSHLQLLAKELTSRQAN